MRIFFLDEQLPHAPQASVTGQRQGKLHVGVDHGTFCERRIAEFRLGHIVEKARRHIVRNCERKRNW